MFQRAIKIDLPVNQSAFLWGPRKSGKSTFLKQTFPNAFYFDFLKSDLFLRIQKEPALLREEIQFKISRSAKETSPLIILDEVQKIPMILDEVHWLMENLNCRFILCGSSARKLKRGQANLLGGRAWRFQMFPLTTKEIGDANILKVFNRGTLPPHYNDRFYHKTLQAYIHDYLKEEIMAEGLTRNLKAFSLFLDSVAFANGEMVNFANIARDCAVDAKTVKEYYQILVDTNLGYFVNPYSKSPSRAVISKTPKFYLFDVGVSNALCRQSIQEERGILFGKSMEQFIFLEIKAYSAYSEKDFEIFFWRTPSGREVDFILGGNQAAIEVKGSADIRSKEIKQLKKYQNEYKPQKSILVCNAPYSRISDNIHILNWKDFLKMLWQGEII